MATSIDLFNEAVRHHQAGDLERAERLYRDALRADPEHAHAYFNLGVILRKKGQRDEAAYCFRQVLLHDPANARAHGQLGNILRDQELLAEATQCYERALAADPSQADAHNNLGVLFKQQGQTARAIRSYQSALAINAEYADAHNNLGIALFEQGQYADASACFRRALATNPRLANAHINLGNAYLRDGQPAQAASCYRQALALSPGQADLADVYNNLGTALEALGNIAEAIDAYRQVLRIDPQSVNGHHNLSFALARSGQLREAWAHNREALRLNPGYGPALFQRALLNLLEGNYEEAWPDYEQRWALPNVEPPRLAEPRWDGAVLEGKTIFVYAEQGLGDTIQFARFLPLVAARGGKIVLGCQPALVPLCQGIPGVERVITPGAPVPAYDVHVPLLSLPGIFESTLATIPASIPYLSADPTLAQRWRNELTSFSAPHEGGAGGGYLPAFKIGIAWHGSALNKGNAYRCVPFGCFEPLARLPGVRLFSLQVGSGTEQLGNRAFPIIDLGKHFDKNSLADLAAVLVNLDLVITIETAVAHLAGALAVPVWTLLPFVPDWRWLLNRSDSPWYPTMRLFRQSKLGQWDDVLARVRAELEARLVERVETPRREP